MAAPSPARRLPDIPDEQLAAMDLLSQQQLDRFGGGRAENSNGDTQLSDSSLWSQSEQEEEPVPDSGVRPITGAKSYTDAQRESVGDPFAGGGKTTDQAASMELERAKQQEMLERSRQFTGEGQQGGGEASEQTQNENARGQTQQSATPPRAPQLADMGDDSDQAGRLAAEQEAERRALDEQAQAAATRKRATPVDELLSKQLTIIKLSLTGEGFVTFGVMWIPLLFLWNYQACRTFLFKNPRFPKLKTPEVIGCIGCNAGCAIIALLLGTLALGVFAAASKYLGAVK